MQNVQLTDLRNYLGRYVNTCHMQDKQFMIYRHKRPLVGLVPGWQLEALSDAKRASNIEYRNYQLAEKVVKMEALHQAMRRIQHELGKS